MKQLSAVIAPGDGRSFAGKISFEDRIARVEPAAGAPGDYIMPGLVDLQVNGSHGIDVMEAAPESILRLAAHLAREGTTAFIPTAVTAPLERIERVHAAIAQAAQSQNRPRDAADAVATGAGAAILGMHLEGPFISPARMGAHPRLNLAPLGEPLERVLALDWLRVLTLAPELDGAIDAIRRLTARGVAVSIGHTDASFAQAQAAIAAGARMFTHLFNAMRPLHHREPGVVAAAMLPSQARAAVIPDGLHVDPAILRMVLAARGPSGTILTTDKVALAATAPGPHPDARAHVEGGVARLKDGTIAGSVISMLDGARLMVEKAGASVGMVAMMAASNPAALLGLDDRGRLAAGARADFLIVSPQFELKAVFIDGREL